MHVSPKRITQFQNQCGINLQKLQLSVTHHRKPPWLWLFTGQGITHITNTSSSSWSVVAIHGKLSEGNHIGFRGAVLFEMLQKNTGRVGGCSSKSLKKCIKRTIQGKKCKVDPEKVLKCVKRAESCNKTKTCANKSGLEATCTWHKSDYFSALAYSS